MEGEGFEPSKAEPTDLQSAPFDRSGTPPNEAEHYQVFRFCCQSLGYRPLELKSEETCYAELIQGINVIKSTCWLSAKIPNSFATLPT